MTSKIIVSAHQPNFLPYLGFFDKMKKSDVFVIRDEVLYIKKEYHNRNKIRINSHNNLEEPKSKWISVPVQDPKNFIKHARIKDIGWEKDFLKELKVNYERTPFFPRLYPEIEKIIGKKHEMLIDLSTDIIYLIKDFFKINTKIISASELNLKSENYEKSDGSQDLADICHKLGATIYLSGEGGKNYLRSEPFDEKNIKIEFQEYEHPIYPQAFPGFLPYMNALDALFCTGTLPEKESPKQIPILKTR